MSTCTRWVDKGVIECKQWADRWTRRCKDWGTQQRERCEVWADEGYSVCARYEDHGYNQCNSWSKKCKSWLPWPLSYICEAFEAVCTGWVWVTNIVCVAYVWISNMVCKAWSTIVESVCVAWFWVLEAVCVVVSWVAKLVCIAWDTVRCAITGVARWVDSLFTKRSRKIRHVFVLMLENRSFDHMFGFSDIAGTDSVTAQPTHINDLLGAPLPSNRDPGTGTDIFPAQPTDFALTSTDGDPGHEFHDVLEQLTGQAAGYPTGGAQSYPPINGSGFVANLRHRGSAAPEKAMGVYAPHQLPILNALAREFAVCDNWFSSMPGPTWPNRLFVHAASSAGLDDSPGAWDTVTTTLIDGYRFDNGTIYDRIEDKCLQWLVFEGDETPQVFSLAGMSINAMQGRFRDFDDFADSVNDPRFPASYTFIEPHYGNIMPWTPEDFTCGTSQHPLDDVTRGEQLIKAVYETIRGSPHWGSSLLIVTYDEHGGFYDHVPPPQAVHPGDSITDNDNNHNNFDFRQLGVRVPAVVVSPFIPRNIVDHKLHDHSSILRTTAEIFGFRSLTNRDATAESLTHLLSLAKPRTDTPLTLPPIAESDLRCAGEVTGAAVGAARSGLLGREQWEVLKHDSEEARAVLRQRKVEPQLRGFMQVALRRYLAVVPASQHDEILRSFFAIESSYDARVFINEAKQAVRAHKLLHQPRKPWRLRARMRAERSKPEEAQR